MSYQIVIPKPVPSQVYSKIIPKVSDLKENPRPTGIKKTQRF